MLRYGVSFPKELSRAALQEISTRLSQAANDKQFRDVVLAEGGTITDLRRRVMAFSKILLLAAVFVFIVDALKVPTPVNLTSVGLAFFAGSFLVSRV